MNPWGVPPPPPATESEFFNNARFTVFMLVEGNFDERFWLPRVDRRSCQVRAVGGREDALRQLRERRAEGRHDFVAVLDADFDRLDGTLLEDPDVVWTDLHDLECLFIASPALEKVLAARASQDKLRRFAEESSRDLREVILANAQSLGRLRWLSRREHLNLKFRKRKGDDFQYLKYADFCEKTMWLTDDKKLVRAVVHFNSRHELESADLLTRANALPDVDPWQVCVGHDLVGILHVGLQKKLGSDQHLSLEDLQDLLSVAFEQIHLQATAMYRALRVWEEKHPRFRVFAWADSASPR